MENELRATLCWAEEEATRLWLKHAEANRVELANIYDGHRRALKALLQREEPEPDGWLVHYAPGYAPDTFQGPSSRADAITRMEFNGGEVYAYWERKERRVHLDDMGDEGA